MSKITYKRISLFIEYLLNDMFGLLIGLAIAGLLGLIVASIFFVIAALVSSFFKAFGFFKCMIWVVYLSIVFLLWIPVFWVWFKMHWENSGEFKREEIS